MKAESRKERVSELFDRLAEGGGSGVRRDTPYHKYVVRLVKRLVPDPARVLELGSGTGDLLAALKPARGVGVDISQGMIDLARRNHPGLDFRHADAESLELDEDFDTVMAVNLIGLLDDAYACFCRAREVLSCRGRLVVVYYNHLWEPILRLATRLGLRAPVPHENWLPLADLRNLLHLTGFEVVRSGRRMLCPVDIPLLARLMNSLMSPLPGFQALSLIEYVVARPVGGARNTGDQAPSCSIIIPTKDEKGNIEDAVRRTVPMGRHTEFIFVDGHSTDGTVAEIERVKDVYADRDIKFAFQDGKGKADAVLKGFEMAKGDVLMILDSDLTMPPEDLPKYYDVLVSGRAEFVNGCRLVYPMEEEAMRLLNKIANYAFGKIFSWVMEQQVRDTLCGTKVLYREDCAKIVANRSYFGGFDPFGDCDLLFGAARLNLKIRDLPVRYRERTYGEIKIHRWRHGLLLLRMSILGARKLKFI